MNLPVVSTRLPDTQSEADSRGIPLGQAGIARYSLPFSIRDVDERACATVAEIQASVSLFDSDRGAHMSRFIVFLNELGGQLHLDSLPFYAECIAKRLDAVRGSLKIDFPWYLKKAAPHSGIEGLLEIRASYQVTSVLDGPTSLHQEVRVPATSLCPCSRAISKYGAHNQRCIVTVRTSATRPFSIQTLVDAVERNASCELYPVLKRADEKVITERAYENAKFVEDIVRDVATDLQKLPGLARFEVRCESLESIHNHSAFAAVTSADLEAPVSRDRIDHADHATHSEPAQTLARNQRA